jgi:CRP/FNR family transcriptional regulator, nitrogen fixation regulation protein
MLIRAAVQPGYRMRSSAIERMGRPRFFARNMQIYREAEPADYVYKLISGTVRTCRVFINGRRQIAAFYLPGDFLGLERGEEHVFSAEAVTDVRLLVIDRSALVLRAKCDNDISRQLWTLMRRELQIAQDHVGLLIKTASERVASFLLEMADRIQSRDEVRLPMSRQDIADYLGLTIETVSRTFTQLENASVIALPCYKRIVLRDRLALKRLVEGDCNSASGMDKVGYTHAPSKALPLNGSAAALVGRVSSPSV